MSSQYKDLNAPDFIPGPLWKKSSSSMSLERAGESLGKSFSWKWTLTLTSFADFVTSLNVSAQHKM